MRVFLIVAIICHLTIHTSYAQWLLKPALKAVVRDINEKAAAAVERTLVFPASDDYYVSNVSITLSYKTFSTQDRKVWGDVILRDKLWPADTSQALFLLTQDKILADSLFLKKGRYTIFLEAKSDTTCLLRVFNGPSVLMDDFVYKLPFYRNMNRQFIYGKEVGKILVKLKKARYYSDWSMYELTKNGLYFRWADLEYFINIRKATN